jgi:hypothetical protein
MKTFLIDWRASVIYIELAVLAIVLLIVWLIKHKKGH